MAELKSTTSSREQVYQCQVCSARLLRRVPIDPQEPCPRCGQEGYWQRLALTVKSEASWVSGLFACIEGQNGPVLWQ